MSIEVSEERFSNSEPSRAPLALPILPRPTSTLVNQPQHELLAGRGVMSAAALLSLYVTVDTTRALLVFGALHSGVELAPSALTFGAEVLKLVVAVVGVFYTTPAGQARFLLSEKSPNESFYSYARPYLRFAIPAALYGTNNVLYFTGLKITSPALLQVCVLSKVRLSLSHPRSRIIQ